MIALYQTRDPAYGYNLTDGGEGPNGVIVSEKTKAKMSAHRQGVNAHRYGKKMPESAKQMVSDKLKKKSVSLLSREKMASKKNKQVYQYTLNGDFVNVFDSATQAGQKTNINRGNLCACCRHVVRQAGGYFWSYEPIENPETIRNHVSGKEVLPSIHARNTKAITQTDHSGNVIQRFNSIKEAADACGYTAQQICYCCSHPNAVSGPYKWRYTNEH